MGNRRKEKNITEDGDESDASATNSRGAGAGKNSKYEVFEFAEDDLLVETDSRKYLSKFKIESPRKRPRYDHPEHKYAVLARYANGDTNLHNDPGDRTSNRTDATVQAGSRTASVAESLNSHEFECLSRGKKSNVCGNRRLGVYMNEQNKNNILHLDSDEDGGMPLRTSSCPVLGSLEEQPSQHGTCRNDCEGVVIVAPKYVKYEKIYYTNCSLSFTSGYIRLDGSSLCERDRCVSLEWSTFDIVKIEYQQCASAKADVVNLHLKFVDASGAEACSTDPGFKELEFVVLDDSQWFTKQEKIKSLDPKYENSWETIISECSFSRPFDEIMYPEGDPDAVFIRMEDVELLQPRTFLNDTIIDFYIKYIVNKMKPEEQQRFHFFNTFFFRKLADMDRVLSLSCEGTEAFQRVRKWTRNINLFEKDYIFIPINFSFHWSLVVVCYPGEVANLRDKDMNDSYKKPCILHMDSIRGSHRGLENIIRSYLGEEWKARHVEQEVDISLRFCDLRFQALQLPQQENLFDCGLFLLHYAELFLAQAVNFSTTKYSDYLNEDWFLPAEVSVKKREHIKKLIHGVVENSLLRNPPPENYHSSALDEGDSGVKVLQESNENETCDGTKFSIGVDHDMKVHQSFCGVLNPATDDVFQQYEQMVKKHFSNMELRMEEEAVEKEGTGLTGDTSCTNEARGDDKPVPIQFPLNSSQVEEMETPCATYSKTCVSTSQTANDLKISEDYVHEVSSASENEKEEFLEFIVEDSEEESGNKITRSSELIVDDSEEENGTEIIRYRMPRVTPVEVIDVE